MTEEVQKGATTDEFQERVASCIKSWREAEPAMSREQLAGAMGRSMATVQRWERDGDPRLSEVHSMEALKPGLLRKIFPALPPSPGADAKRGRVRKATSVQA